MGVALISNPVLPQARQLGTVRSPQGQHYRALDGLRGLAILAVIFNHYGPFVFTGSSPYQAALFWAARHAYIGVDLFFVISGFLITGILVDSRRRHFYLRRYFWRRSLRIFPLYFFYLFLVFVVRRYIGPVPPHSVNQLWYLTYLANWHMAPDMVNPYLAHLWSLCVEEQFYIVWPFFVLLFSMRQLLSSCIALMIFSMVFRIIAAGYVDTMYIFILTPARMDALAAGAIIAIVVRNKDLAMRTKAAGIPVALLSVIVWSLTVPTSWEQKIGYTCSAIFFSLVVFWTVTLKPKSLAIAPLRTIGKYSYGLYMYHVLLRGAFYHASHKFFQPPLDNIVFLVTSLGAMAGMTLLSWWVVESPFLRLKDRHFASQLDAALAPRS